MEIAPHGAPVAFPWYSICFTNMKAKWPIEVTLEGIVTFPLVYSKKAESPIEVTATGILTSIAVPIYAINSVMLSSE